MRSIPISEFQDRTGIQFKMFEDKTNGEVPSLEIEFLGTAGFIIRAKDRTLVIDPYLSRPGRFAHGFMNFSPNEDLIKKHIHSCDDILIGHSHSDHLMDAPFIAKEFKARIIGTRTTTLISRAAGVPEHLTKEAEAGQRIPCTGAETYPNPGSDAQAYASVLGISSLHAPVIGTGSLGKNLQNGILFPGEYNELEEIPPWPLRVWEFVEGGVLDWLIEIGGKSVVHIDSARVLKDKIESLEVAPVDVLFLCAMGWKARKGEDAPDYIKTVIEALQPKIVIPCHWDNMFDPYPTTEKEGRVWGRCDLKGFYDELTRHVCEEKVQFLNFNGTVKV